MLHSSHTEAVPHAPAPGTRGADQPTHWTLDGARSQLRLVAADGAAKAVDLGEATGRVVWREGGTGFMRLSLGGCAPLPAGFRFDGGSEEPLEGGSLVVVGMLRCADRMHRVSVHVVPTIFRAISGTDCMDIEVEGDLPPALGAAATRVEGVLRIFRRGPAA